MDLQPRPISQWKKFIDKWYLKRFHAAKEWEKLMIREHGIDTVVRTDHHTLGFRTISPIIFLPCFHKREKYVISVKNYESEIPPVTLTIRSEPMIFLCLCKFYNDRHSTVTISREHHGHDVTLYGLQLSRGTFVTPTHSSVRVTDKGHHIFSRINKRTAHIQRRINVHNVPVETYHIRDFCKGDHDVREEIFKQYCAQCNGHIMGSPELRKCDCLELHDSLVLPSYEYDSDVLIMPSEWEPFKLERG